jgi:4-carboxymuconolactone decarboxylase
MSSPECREPSRVAPITPPYRPELQAVFDKVMPPGVAPLKLFTTLARAPRIYDRFRAGSLLDRGPVPLRSREIVINRTCARCGCSYEWGVHVAFFADRAELTSEQVRATFRGNANDAAWSNEERVLIRLVDELHDTGEISDELWNALVTTFNIEQIFELIALVGSYRTVSFFANGLKLAAEPYAVSPPPLGQDDLESF